MKLSAPSPNAILRELRELRDWQSILERAEQCGMQVNREAHTISGDASQWQVLRFSYELFGE